MAAQALLRITCLLALAVALAGCGSESGEPAAETPEAPATGTRAAGDHDHEHTEALVWLRTIRHQGFEIRLGHHGGHLHAGEAVEPAVSISRDGQPVPDARVFNALVSADSKAVIAEEAATVYEPATDEEPAHYAQGELMVPADGGRIAIRYRIVLPGDAGEVSYDLPVEVET